MAYMGIDIGTTGCKALVFDATGRMKVSAYREYVTIMPRPGWAELDSRLVMDACFEVISESAAQASEPIAALAISSQGEAFTPVDDVGAILGNAQVSFDTRAAAIAGEWSEKFGREKLYRITGHTAHPMFTLFKLLWMKRHQPEIWHKTAKFLCFEDLLAARLGATPTMGWPLAGRTMLFDVTRKTWNQEIIDAVGLRKEQLAMPMASGSVSGIVKPDIAAKLGLSTGVKIVTGGHDQVMGALGAGVINEGSAMYATGTVECITPAFSRPIFSESLFNNNLCTYNHAIDAMFATVAFSLTGGNILKWFRDEFGQREVELAKTPGAVNAYEQLMRQMTSTPSSLLVLPYFTPTGTPYFDPDATGAILGLKLSTTRGELLRALLESVALEMKLNMKLLERAGIVINELRAIGGGAKNRVWTQLKADVMNKPITTLEITEAGCLGAAALACAADSEEDIRHCINRWVKPGIKLVPNPEYADIYEEKFLRYKTLYPALKPLL